MFPTNRTCPLEEKMSQLSIPIDIVYGMFVRTGISSILLCLPMNQDVKVIFASADRSDPFVDPAFGLVLQGRMSHADQVTIHEFQGEVVLLSPGPSSRRRKGMQGWGEEVHGTLSLCHKKKRPTGVGHQVPSEGSSQLNALLEEIASQHARSCLTSPLSVNSNTD